VLARGISDRPDLSILRESVGAYVDLRSKALSDGDHQSRVEACWGIIAQGAAAIPWATEGIAGDDPDWAADAASVLAWIDRTPELTSRIEAMAETLPDGEARDTLFEALGHEDSPPEEGGQETGSQELFDGRLAGFTERVWFVEGSFEEVKRELIAWDKEMDLNRSFTEVRKPLEEALSLLEPRSVPTWRFLLTETAANWCAVFSQGSDIYPTHVLARRLHSRSLETDYSPHIVRGGAQFSLGNMKFWCRNEGGPESNRGIQATYQSRWEWHEMGEPFPFEMTDRYEAKRVKDRFDLALLNGYCAALGIDRANPDFYGPRVILVRDDLSRWNDAPSEPMPSAEWLKLHNNTMSSAEWLKRHR
jgi:hypothetical protein